MSPQNMNSTFRALEAGRAPTGEGQNAGGAARKKKGRKANQWHFHSCKRNRLLVFEGDAVFASVLLLEMNANVATYWVEGEDTATDEETSKGNLALIWVEYVDGSRELWHCSREKTKISDELKQLSGHAKIVMRTISDAEAERVLLDNALQLCAAMTAARDFDVSLEIRSMISALRARSPLPLEQLLHVDDMDPGLAYAAFARMVVKGVVAVALDRQLLSSHTLVALGGGGQV